jgi:hypothetical protein
MTNEEHEEASSRCSNACSSFLTLLSKIETKAQIHQDPLRGINAAGLAISRSFDLGGRFLPETPKRGGSLWTRFSLAQSENGKTEIVSTATI